MRQAADFKWIRSINEKKQSVLLNVLGFMCASALSFSLHTVDIDDGDCTAAHRCTRNIVGEKCFLSIFAEANEKKNWFCSHADVFFYALIGMSVSVMLKMLAMLCCKFLRRTPIENQSHKKVIWFLTQMVSSSYKNAPKNDFGSCILDGCSFFCFLFLENYLRVQTYTDQNINQNEQSKILHVLRNLIVSWRCKAEKKSTMHFRWLHPFSWYFFYLEFVS